MTKFLRRFVAAVGVMVVLFLVLALSGHVRIVDARLTGTNPTGSSADTFCVGPKTYEVCADYLGDFLPTTTNTQTLGTSSLVWSNVYGTTLTSGSGGVVNSAGPVGLAVQTTTQLSLLAKPVGSTYLAKESVAGVLVADTYNICTSTKNEAGDFVYISVSTSAAAVLGAKCSS